VARVVQAGRARLQPRLPPVQRLPPLARVRPVLTLLRPLPLLRHQTLPHPLLLKARLQPVQMLVRPPLAQQTLRLLRPNTRSFLQRN
jgi:hypothetical protein